MRQGYPPNVTHAPALVGLETGILVEHLGPDIALTTTTFNAGPSAIEALFIGAIDATYIGPLRLAYRSGLVPLSAVARPPGR